MEPEQEAEPTPTPQTPKIILKTGANVDVTFSSDEEGPGGLSSIQEEESSAPEAQNEINPSTPNPPTPLKFSMPTPKPVEEEPAVMDFESALGMLKKNKELKAKKEAEENNNEEIELKDEYETIKSSGGRTFRSRPRPPGEEQAEAEEEPEAIDYDEEIEIGELRGLEEDDRIIIVAPKEESTVEASGEENEDEAPESDGSDGPTSETVQGVKIKFKSSAQIPPTMVEEAEIAALDKLEVVTAPLPPMKPEKRDSEPSETEQKIDILPAPPGEIDEGKDEESNLVESWDWEAKESRKNSYPDTESIVSSEVQINTRPKRKEPEQVGKYKPNSNAREYKMLTNL